eukprot:749312-Hanusia_phi.AAC.3
MDGSGVLQGPTPVERAGVLASLLELLLEGIEEGDAASSAEREEGGASNEQVLGECWRGVRDKVQRGRDSGGRRRGGGGLADDVEALGCLCKEEEEERGQERGGEGFWEERTCRQRSHRW